MSLLERSRSGPAVGAAAAEQRTEQRAAKAGDSGGRSRSVPRPRLPSLLLRWKLTIFFGAVVALMLGSFSLLFYWYLDNSLTRDIHQSSLDKADQVVDGLRRAIDVEQAVIRGPFVTSAEVSLLQRWGSLETIAGDWLLQGVAVRLYDASGRLVDSNDASLDHKLSAPERIPIDYSGLVQAARSGQAHRQTLATRDLGAYYSIGQPVMLNGRPWAVVEVLTPLETNRHTLERLRRVLALGTLIATAMSLFVGAAFSEAALRPIAALTRTARRIHDEQDLSQRVPDEGARDELGRLAATVNAMLDQIEGMFDRQRRFLSDVSHELRTPLTTIRGEAELMQYTGRMDPEALGAIQSEAERMSRLVEDLLMLARNEEQSAMAQEPVDLSSLLREVGRQARVLGAEHHAIELDAPEGPTWVRGDRDRLKQLVLNLVGNALSHTPEGTTIRLSLDRQADRARLRVADDGPGIPAEDLPFLFDRFYRVDKARHRASGGAGLGLAIVQAVARAHGGKVEVDSRPGAGTAFTVGLPLTAAAG